jgi:hypothetical protein
MNLQLDTARSPGHTGTSMTARLTSRTSMLGGLVVLLIVVIVPL